MPAAIGPLADRHLPQLAALANAHLDSLLPGWALPEAYLRDRLHRHPEQYVIDPWVRERLTLGAIERGRLVAAAHLLRYGAEPEVGDHYQNTADLAWFLFWPEHAGSADRLLRAVDDQWAAWSVARAYAWDAGLPVALAGGVPDEWPHIAAALTKAGYAPDADTREAVYGGWLDQIPAPGEPPVPGLSVKREMGKAQTRFTAVVTGQPVGHCECTADLTLGGELPALRGWAELGALYVAEGWRSRGVGAWLVQHAVAWLRLGGCARIVLSVAPDDEARGAGRFYQRLGWRALTRCRRGWTRAPYRPSPLTA